MVGMNLFTKATFRTNAQAVADDQHPDHQLWINGWASRRTVKITQILANAGEFNKPVNGTKKMFVGNMLFEAETVE